MRPTLWITTKSVWCWAGDMVQRVKSTCHQDCLNPVPRTHVGEELVGKLPLNSKCMHNNKMLNYN